MEEFPVSEAITVRLPKRCIYLLDKMIEAGIFNSRSEAVRFIVRMAFVEGIHKKLLPEDMQD